MYLKNKINSAWTVPNSVLKLEAHPFKKTKHVETVLCSKLSVSAVQHVMDGVNSFPSTQACLYNWWEQMLLGKKISTPQSTLRWAVTRSPPQCTGAGSEVGVLWPHQCVCPRPLGIWLRLIAYTWEHFKSQRSTVADPLQRGVGDGCLVGHL